MKSRESEKNVRLYGNQMPIKLSRSGAGPAFDTICINLTGKCQAKFPLTACSDSCECNVSKWSLVYPVALAY
jgi:hypothetical protein